MSEQRKSLLGLDGAAAYWDSRLSYCAPHGLRTISEHIFKALPDVHFRITTALALATLEPPKNRLPVDLRLVPEQTLLVVRHESQA